MENLLWRPLIKAEQKYLRKAAGGYCRKNCYATIVFCPPDEYDIFVSNEA